MKRFVEGRRKAKASNAETKKPRGRSSEAVFRDSIRACDVEDGVGFTNPCLGITCMKHVDCLAFAYALKSHLLICDPADVTTVPGPFKSMMPVGLGFGFTLAPAVRTRSACCVSSKPHSNSVSQIENSGTAETCCNHVRLSCLNLQTVDFLSSKKISRNHSRYHLARICFLFPLRKFTQRVALHLSNCRRPYVFSCSSSTHASPQHPHPCSISHRDILYALRQPKTSPSLLHPRNQMPNTAI